MNNVLWSAIEAAAAAGFAMISSFVIARIIGPAELGVAAAAVSVHVLLWVVVNALFADALVQRTEVSGLMVSSASWTSLAVGCIALGIQILAGWVLARLLADFRLGAMCLLLAIPLPLVGVAGVRQGILTRQRAYRRLAMRTILGQGIAAVVGVGLALQGFGSWAMVAQQTVGSFVGAATLIAGGNLRLNRAWRWEPVRDLLSIGLPLTASTLAQFGRYRLFALVIGGSAGPTTLGEVHMAFRLVDSVRELTFTALWRLMLPVLSRHQSDRAAMLADIDRLLGRSALVMMPLCAGIAVALGPAVALILGPRWAAIGVTGYPLVVLMGLSALMFPSGVALVAAGRARVTLHANLLGLVATAAAVLVLQPSDARQAVLAWCGSQVVISAYALWATGRVFSVGPLRPLRAGLPAAMCCLGAAVMLVMLGAAPIDRLLRDFSSMVPAGRAVPGHATYPDLPPARKAL